MSAVDENKEKEAGNGPTKKTIILLLKLAISDKVWKLFLPSSLASN